MRPNESGTTRVSMSRTIASLNDLRIFVTRSSADSITFDTIRKRSKPCFIPFFKMDVELFMRTYIVRFNSGRQHHRALAVDNRQHLMSCVPVWPEPCTGPVKESITKSDSFQILRAECAIFKLSICPNVG